MNDSSYIIGSFALWAGDYARAKEFFSSHLETAGALNDPRQPKSAPDLITRAQERRLGQIIRMTEEFQKQVAALPKESREITAGGLQLRGTKHLEAVLFRTGARQFEMRAYLTDLSWASQLILNAAFFASRPGSVTAESKDFPVHEQPSGELPFAHDFDEDDDEVSPTPTGFSWEIPGPLFIEVHVSRLGLITARGFWHEHQLPESYLLEKTFHQILSQLDSQLDGKTASK